MDAELFTNLAWLQPAPADFRARRQALSFDTPQLGKAVRRLATHALGEGQLAQLSATIAGLASQGADLSPLTPFKLGIVGNGTLDLIASTLTASAARHGVLLDCIVADFAQTIQEAQDPGSKINQARPDAVLLLVDHRSLPGLGRSAEEPFGFVAALREGFRRNCGAVCIVPTFAPPAESLFGSLDRRLEHTTRGALDRLNRALAEDLAVGSDVLFDVAALAELVGLASWYSPEQWNLAKLPFSATHVPLFADHVGRILGALKGKSRRCLILDLDNTIWGGVIGDDGMEGVKLAQGDAVGEAFLEVQRTALQLRERGVVLAVSSKNTDEVARRMFQHHPEMLLREDHIAVFQANWEDKATNIKAIAETLSLGLESMVFLDDNPVERGLVRELLPEVAVPEVGADPALYARTLLAAGYFEAVTFTSEDRARAEYYQDNAKRVALRAQAGEVDAYLASLDMEIVFAPFDAAGRARISQLINKSNQFNLTTRRYSEADVAAMQDDPSVLTLQVRLIDHFGDNGMISVVVCRPREPEVWEIDTWLMSCRVLGRKVEHMVLREVLEAARANGIERLVGVYLPTDRNGMVRDHYQKLGFTKIADRDDGGAEWILSTDLELSPAPMRVKRVGPLETVS